MFKGLVPNPFYPTPLVDNEKQGEGVPLFAGPQKTLEANFRASGSVRRHCPLPFLLLPLSLVSLVCSVVLSPSLRSPSSPSPQATLSPISLSRMYVCMHECIYVCM